MLVPVRISDVATTPLLDTDGKIHAIATALQEVAIAQALVMIHGKERGAQRYVEYGGHVRFDDDGEPIIYVEAKP